MTILEAQVVEIEDDITALSVGLMEVDENLDFLFDEQVIPDERLLNLEETSDEIIGELDLMEDELESEYKQDFPLFCMFVHMVSNSLVGVS